MENMLSPADVAVLTGNNGRNNNDGVFGGENGAWWIIILLLFGWGRNGFGGGFGGNGGENTIYPNYSLVSDMAQLSRQISDSTNMLERRTDTIINGICDLGYTNQSLINGVNTNILTTSNNTNMAISNLGYNLQNCCCDLRQQLADCCCKVERGIDGVNYNLATNTCAITTAFNNGVRDIIDNQNNNYARLHEEILNNRLSDKEERIAEQQNEINALRLKASQEAQNAYLLNELKACPSPAYIVPNPNCCYQYSVTQNSCGCNGGCGNF